MIYSLKKAKTKNVNKVAGERIERSEGAVQKIRTKTEYKQVERRVKEELLKKDEQEERDRIAREEQSERVESVAQEFSVQQLTDVVQELTDRQVSAEERINDGNSLVESTPLRHRRQTEITSEGNLANLEIVNLVRGGVVVEC